MGLFTVHDRELEWGGRQVRNRHDLAVALATITERASVCEMTSFLAVVRDRSTLQGYSPGRGRTEILSACDQFGRRTRDRVEAFVAAAEERVPALVSA